MKVLRRMAVVLVALLLIGAAAWLYAIHWAPDRADWPRQGIAVASRQGAIDWPLVAQQQVDFAYIKASEGGDRRDPMFDANWRGAGQAKIARGALHVFSLCVSGAKQATNFIGAVAGDGGMLAPAIDLSFEDNCAERPSPEALIAELMAFLRAVELRYRQPAILRLTRDFDAGYGISEHIPRRLWLRSMWTEPKWGARPWTLWHASAVRRIPGIDGAVDWNVARQ